MKTKVKTKINATDVSQITGEPVKKVIDQKMKFIIDRIQNEPPHILWVTKNAFVWGNGKIFSVLDEDNPIRIGFITTYDKSKNYVDRGHLNIRKPSNHDLQVMESKFGYALEFPPSSLFNLIQSSFRKMEKKLNKPESNLRAIPCRGYIQPDPTKEGGHKLIQPNWNRGEDFGPNTISGYFIFRVDEEGRKKVQNQLLDDSDIVLQLQFERARYTVFEINRQRILTGEKLVENTWEQQSLITPILNQLKTNYPIKDWDALIDKDQLELSE